MNKNLKKVISTVAALAISASSFVAMAAQNFPDVAETASYAQAVDELTSLGVIDGYTDGTFGPDKLVSRAEMAKMVVVALGQKSTAEATTGQNTEFTDVPGTHWASGYVAVATSNGFINGMGDGTFAPDSNVQYAQAVKMLVSACGYETAAQSAGGWPSGYMTIAGQNSVLTGLSDLNNSTEMNRGQVAQLIDNAMKMPLTLTTGGTIYDAWGNARPETQVYDGEGDGYQTLLTKFHDTYVVYGRVMNTQQSLSTLDPDEVQFRVEKADNFDGDYYNKEEGPIETMKYGTTNAPDLLFSYAQALVQKDSDDEYTIISITASAKSKVVSDLKADDYETYSTNGTTTISFYTNDNHTKSTSYKLDDDAELYVNGVAFDGTFESGVENYIDGNNIGTVTLIDETEPGSTSTDGKYDKVMVTYYVDAVFDQITSTSSYTRLTFSNNQSGLDKSYIEYDEDDDDVAYNFQLGLNGTVLKYTDLQQDDVLSIAYNVNGNFSASNFYDVYVSRDVVTGTVTDSREDDGTYTYTIDGTDYEASALGDKNLEVGSEYTLYLNVFGKYVDQEEGAGNVDDIAIIDSFYLSSEGTYYATAIRVDGQKYTYELKNQSGADLTTFSKLVYGGDGNYTASSGVAKQPVQERVATIKVNSSNCITLKNTLSYASVSGKDKEYKSSTSRIGSMKIDDSSVLMDLTDYNDNGDYGLMSKSSLTNETEYEAYGFSRNSDSIYRYVLILSGADDINGESPMTVLVSAGSTSVDGDTTDRLKVYSEGEEKYLIVDPDETVTVPTVEGTPFFYTTSGNGYVKSIDTIMTDTYSGDYATFVRNAFAKADVDGNFNSYVKAKYLSNFGTSNKEAYMHFGPIVDKSSSAINLGAIEKIGDANYSSTENDASEYTYGGTPKVYTYAMEAKSGTRVEAGNAGSVLNSTIPNTYKYTEDSTGALVQNTSGEYINWNGVLNDTDDVVEGVNFALVKEYEDDATEVLVFIAK